MVLESIQYRYDAVRWLVGTVPVLICYSYGSIHTTTYSISHYGWVSSSSLHDRKPNGDLRIGLLEVGCDADGTVRLWDRVIYQDGQIARYL